MKFASFYSGAGGLDIGFIRAGFEPVWTNDINADAVATHKAHLKLLIGEEKASKVTVTCGDVRYQKLPNSDEVDIVIGGPPCQGFSVAGRMDPSDPRSKHVWNFFDAIQKLKPQAFVMENVSALAVNRRWKSVIDGLRAKGRELGFNVELFTLNAADFGVPQTRLRMFLVGVKGSDPWLKILKKKRRVTVREAFLNLPVYGELGNHSICSAKITPAKRPVLRRSAFAGMLFNGQGRPINIDAAAPTLPASMGGNRTPIIDQHQLQHGDAAWVIDYHAHLKKNGKPFGRIPDRLRRLTVEEAAIIQGFPLGMYFVGKQSSKFQQIGNAVPPPLAEAVARALMNALNRKSIQGEKSQPSLSSFVLHPD